MRAECNINTSSKYEVLAPAGSYKCMVAAFNAGADAVYLGGNLFGARASADNFSEEELINAIEYAHIRGKKVFLTVNTLLKNAQINNQLYDYIAPLYKAGLDAVIVQDFGVMEFIKKHFPEIDIHASTQMTVTGAEFAKTLKECGVTRIVPARELSYKEINSIYKATELEIECFVHGALCYCYSGMCLLSSIIGGRSGNRGRCAQPCRLPYDVQFEYSTKKIKGEYPLSPADLCTLEILPDILESGVYSLKIEGRMKKPEYVAIVTAMYRKYVDMYEKHGRQGYKVDERDIQMLKDIYNRGEFTDGYYKRHNGNEVMSVKRPNHMGTKAAVVLNYNPKRKEITAKALEDLHESDVLEIFTQNGENVDIKGVDAKEGTTFSIKASVDMQKILGKTPNNSTQKTYIMRTRNNVLISDIEKEYISNDKVTKTKIGGAVVVCRNAPIAVDVWYKNIHAHSEGAIPEEASNRPVTSDDILKQINKTGATDFVFDEKDLTITVEEGLFINIKELNQLRRSALEILRDSLLETSRRQLPAEQVTSTEAIYDKKQELKQTQNKVIDKVLHSAYVCTKEQFDIAVNHNHINQICFEADITGIAEAKAWNELAKIAHNNNKEIFMCLPYVFREHGKVFIKKNMDFFTNNELDGYVFRNMEEICWFETNNLDRKKSIIDNTIYGFNDQALKFIERYNPYLITASYELNMKELNHLFNNKLEICVYGNIPVMVSAGCIKKTYGKCDGKEGTTIVTDRLGNDFICKNHCTFCYNIIFNSRPLLLEDEVDVLSSNFISRKYMFTTENAAETKSILNGQFNGNFTRGHFKRGVD